MALIRSVLVRLFYWPTSAAEVILMSTHKMYFCVEIEEKYLSEFISYIDLSYSYVSVINLISLYL